MSQESRSSSERRQTNDTPYICCVCKVEILDHVYRIQRRTVRAVRYDEVGYPIRHDAIHPWHDGIQLGPYDVYCPKHNPKRLAVQELLDAYHEGVDSGGRPVGGKTI